MNIALPDEFYFTIQVIGHNLENTNITYFAVKKDSAQYMLYFVDTDGSLGEGVPRPTDDVFFMIDKGHWKIVDKDYAVLPKKFEFTSSSHFYEKFVAEQDSPSMYSVYKMMTDGTVDGGSVYGIAYVQQKIRKKHWVMTKTLDVIPDMGD